MFGDIHAIDHRDHLASIYYMLILGINLPTVFRPMMFMVSFLFFSFLFFFQIPRISILLFSLFESVKIGRHSFLFYCVLALAGYFVIFAHSFLISLSRTQSTASGKFFFYFLPSLFSFNLLVPVHMFSCVSFYHSFFSFVPDNLVGWKIWVCTEICFISFNCVIFLIPASRHFPGCVKRTKT